MSDKKIALTNIADDFFRYGFTSTETAADKKHSEQYAFDYAITIKLGIKSIDKILSNKYSNMAQSHLIKHASSGVCLRYLIFKWKKNVCESNLLTHVWIKIFWWNLNYDFKGAIEVVDMKQI